jgi:hypothetical protein
VGIIYEDLPDHEGYAAWRQRDGRITATSPPLGRFDARVAACSCGWTGDPYPPTEQGREQAEQQWEDDHARPLLETAIPPSVAAAIREAQRAVRDLAVHRPKAARAILARHIKWAASMNRALMARTPQARLDGAEGIPEPGAAQDT